VSTPLLKPCPDCNGTGGYLIRCAFCEDTPKYVPAGVTLEEVAALRAALDRANPGPTWLGWLDEAERLWAARCDAVREIDPPDPRPAVPDPGEAWLWVCRVRDVLGDLRRAADALKGPGS